VVSAPANRHDSPLLAPTLDALEALGLPPEPLRPLMRNCSNQEGGQVAQRSAK
jgi:hypothetical protein